MGTVLLVCSGAEVRASSGEREARAAFEEIYLTPAAEACGSRFNVDIDWPSFRSHYDGAYNAKFAAEYCGYVLHTMGNFCAESEQNRASLVAGIRDVKCQWDGEAVREVQGRDGASRRVRGERLVIGYSWKTTGIGETLPEFFRETFLVNNSETQQNFESKRLESGVLEEARQSCDTPLKLLVEWKTFRPNYAQPRESGRDVLAAAEGCESALASLSELCAASTEASRAIKRRVKRIVCRWDPKATFEELKRNGEAPSLKGTTYLIGYNWETVAVGEATADYLRKVLELSANTGELPSQDPGTDDEARSPAPEEEPGSTGEAKPSDTQRPCIAYCEKRCDGRSPKCTSLCRRKCRRQFKKTGRSPPL